MPSGFYRTPAASTAARLYGGAGFRQYYGDRSQWDVKGLYSSKSYKFVEFSTNSWGLAHGKVDFHSRLGWRDATQVSYYGLGMDTVTDDRSNVPAETGLRGRQHQSARRRSHPVFAAGAVYQDYWMGRGQGTVRRSK